TPAGAAVVSDQGPSAGWRGRFAAAAASLHVVPGEPQILFRKYLARAAARAELASLLAGGPAAARTGPDPGTQRSPVSRKSKTGILAPPSPFASRPGRWPARTAETRGSAADTATGASGPAL